MSLIRSGGRQKPREPFSQAECQQDSFLDRQPCDSIPLQLLRACDAAAGARAMARKRRPAAGPTARKNPKTAIFSGFGIGRSADVGGVDKN